ncbi:hypothetical protein [Candidatus Thiosymbion oneisti]|uniref:hypothetical protein n=1 Tax=Candidatus Thiosymbion oneisti TaxID=589554 RepID=UPI00114CDB72|nr:hypothetical protein [Candidatus Thiosymbion oneisti]
MTERRSILLFASAAALTLAVHESALSVSPTDGPAPATAPATVTAEQAPTIEKSSEKSTAAGESIPARAGITPPPSLEQDTAPSRIPKQGTRRGMTPEERSAQWEQRLQKVRERAMRRRQEIQESMERWDSYWKTWDAMTPEQKEAVYAIFGPGHKRCGHRTMDHGPTLGMPMRPRSGRSEFGLPAGPAFPGPGYGYGPRHTRPFPFDWDPAAVPTPPGGVRPQE